MRLRVEFTTEPFDLEEQAPRYALPAREVARQATLDHVDMGPFGDAAEAGATRVSLRADVRDEEGG